MLFSIFSYSLPLLLISKLFFGLVSASEGRSGSEDLEANKKHLVFLSGDEEYRSEEALPLMAQIMEKHGFRCTVLFSVDKDGFVDPRVQSSLTNPEAMDSADALVLFLRFRCWDDRTMRRFESAVHRGVPIIGIRTTTHPFRFPKNSSWFKYSFNATLATGWEKGFGREVMGESWIAHHGKHKKEGTRTFIEESYRDHPILNGVGTMFSKTDVYRANPDPEKSAVLMRGGVTASLEPSSELVSAKNTPMQPLSWVRSYKNEGGTTNRVFTTTMGSSVDFEQASFRRMIANAIFWGLKMDVPEELGVSYEGLYEPTDYGFNKFKKKKYPEDFFPKKKALTKAQKSSFQKTTGPSGKIPLKKNSSIVFIGGNLGARMMHYHHFETEIYTHHPEKNLSIRNMCDGGNTPGFRPHSARTLEKHYAFPGAKEFYPETKTSAANGFCESEDEWLSRLKADVILAFFGYTESYRGVEGLANYKKELDGFLKHTLSKKYNGSTAPKVALISPISFQDLTSEYDYPNGEEQNGNLFLYTEAMREIAKENKVLFVDTYNISKKWFSEGVRLTVDGSQLNDAGYRKFATFVNSTVFGDSFSGKEIDLQKVYEAVKDKNWYWNNDFKIPNGVHAYGRRYKPYGPDNYPYEIKKIRQLTRIRDQAIWNALRGVDTDVAKLDRETIRLPEVKTNFKPTVSDMDEKVTYLSGKESLQKISPAEGYKVELFASEEDFPALANPCQMSFDNQGRLWISTMPSYPQWKPGDGKSDDKIIILEDTDGDYKADKHTVFARNLNLPIGFELTPEGVYVSQGQDLVLLRDLDGDDVADSTEVVLSGFDDHDTHHAISAFCADPSGAFLMGQGLFLNTSVETSYGTVRGDNGGFYRFDPNKRKLEHTANLKIPNPWGIAFNDWGQSFFLFTSSKNLSWMDPYCTKPKYGQSISTENILSEEMVRPTSGLEFVSSRHFPDEGQGDILLCNVIGFRGAKQHQVVENGTGFKAQYRQDLFVSEDDNFRPIDLEFAPDGSLYFIDWHNALIGHMQHNSRDPLRDKRHGRVYRVTYPGRPLVKPPKIVDASIGELLNNLRLHEYRARYRTRRELRARNPDEVVKEVRVWLENMGRLSNKKPRGMSTERWHERLDQREKNFEKCLLEALWVTWGANRLDLKILERALGAKDYRVRTAAVNVLHYNRERVPNAKRWFLAAARDPHRKVVNEAMVAASWMQKEEGQAIMTAAKENLNPLDKINQGTFACAEASLLDKYVVKSEKNKVKTALKGFSNKLFHEGNKIYNRDGSCVSCHQEDGKGLSAAGYPPLHKSDWVRGNEDRLIKLTMKGLMGPIVVNGKHYPGNVPMTPYEKLLNDREMSAVLTYIRNSFGNRASPIYPRKVKEIRAGIKEKIGFYSPDELLEDHPMEKN